ALILLFWSGKSQPVFVAPTVSNDGHRRSSRWDRWSLSRAKKDKVASQPNLPASLRGEGVVIVNQPYMLSESEERQSRPITVGCAKFTPAHFATLSFSHQELAGSGMAILHDLPLNFMAGVQEGGSRKRLRIVNHLPSLEGIIPVPVIRIRFLPNPSGSTRWHFTAFSNECLLSVFLPDFPPVFHIKLKDQAKELPRSCKVKKGGT
ncbi:hypothetical protein Chor_016139, partial [Crotalus horridus]